MNRPAYLTEAAIAQFIHTALDEDIGEGDHSSLATIPQEKITKAKLLVKDDGIIAGIELAEKIFHAIDPTLLLSVYKKDGDSVLKGEVAFEVSGNARAILSAERLVLNCMQRMSGIATKTHHLGELIKNTRTQLLDTRKTTPNFRLLEKWAVAIGGGRNHRFALYDMIMLKDNHLDVSGGIAKAVGLTVNYLKDHQKDLLIEVETRNLNEVKEALATHAVDVIMLDNMSTIMMKEAVAMVNHQCKTEASGGITESNLTEVAECGVDYISIGALTHSVKSLDLSLKVF
ncbi:MAG: carboxylating nicotinate-nucleotide diphosphorylase [Bacteroidetes bacterium]|nr:carboxylating nicotinate-nucleotide diphosphorylase [Bacteroidota bacterium]